MSEHEHVQKRNNREGLFSKLSPKTSFFLGLGGALGIFFIVGFFVLLGIVLSGNKSSTSGKETASTPSAAAPAAARQPQAAPSPANIQLAEITDKDWVRGNRNAKISIVEFSDLQCPFCRRFHPTMKQVLEEYGDKVNWVYRHFPLTSIHQYAQSAAEASECIGELRGNDAFWQFIDKLFDKQEQLGKDFYIQTAQELGVDKDKFENCLNSGKYTQKVQDSYNQAVAAGGRGTPYSVVVTKNGQKIPVSGAVPFSQLKAIIDPLL